MLEILKPEYCNDLINQTCFEAVKEITNQTFILYPLIIIFSLMFLIILIIGMTHTKIGNQKSKYVKFTQSWYWASVFIPFVITMLLLYLLIIYPVYLIFI